MFDEPDSDPRPSGREPAATEATRVQRTAAGPRAAAKSAPPRAAGRASGAAAARPGGEPGGLEVRQLDERKLSVLRAIVQDYVGTEEPVGSKALVERHNLGVSPATVRNDMATLEEDGYIQQPHTSAGRIPTDKGYRLFVDRLAEVKPMSAPSGARSGTSWTVRSTWTTWSPGPCGCWPS